MSPNEDDMMNVRRDEDMYEERMRMSRRRLFPLDELDDYEVADDDPDIRGWDVLGEDGEKIGEVEELIVDPDLLKVRYLDVVAEDDLGVGEDERHLLVPIGAVRLDDDKDNVMLDGIKKQTLKSYPLYTGGPITLDYEHTLSESVLNRKMQNPEASSDEMYNDELYNENRLLDPVRRRRGNALSNEASPYIRKRENE